MIRTLALATVFSLAMTSSALAAIEVEDAYAEMMEGNATRGDIFFKITNSGETADRLYAVKTKVAGKAILEASSEKEVQAGDEQQATALEVAPGKTLTLSEDGAHVELLDLKAPLKPGDTFTARLFFEEAGVIKVKVVVGEE